MRNKRMRVYLCNIVFRKNEDSKWENGIYIGDGKHSDFCIFLDKYYNPVDIGDDFQVMLRDDLELKGSFEPYLPQEAELNLKTHL